jgi:hypothetical protein
LLPTVDFPPQYKAGRTIATKRVTSARSKPPPLDTDATPSIDTNTKHHDSEAENGDADSEASIDPPLSSMDVTDSQLAGQVEALCANLKAGGARPSSKRNLTSASPAVPISLHASSNDDAVPPSDEPVEPPTKRRDSHVDFASAISNVAVTYEDPESLRRRTMNESDRMVLMTTNIRKNREAVTTFFSELGCTVRRENHYVTSTTHVLVGEPCRNEKYLAGCAAGAWVLCADEYYRSCKKAGCLLPEDSFEWTRDRAVAMKLPAELAELAAAAHKWRELVQAKHCRGAFETWKVVLLVGDGASLPCFQRLIEAGSGRVLATVNSSDAELVDGLKDATHVLSDAKLQGPLPSKVSVKKIRVLQLEYLAEYLKNPKTPTKQWVVNDLHRLG